MHHQLPSLVGLPLNGNAKRRRPKQRAGSEATQRRDARVSASTAPLEGGAQARRAARGAKASSVASSTLEGKYGRTVDSIETEERGSKGAPQGGAW